MGSIGRVITVQPQADRGSCSAVRFDQAAVTQQIISAAVPGIVIVADCEGIAGISADRSIIIDHHIASTFSGKGRDDVHIAIDETVIRYFDTACHIIGEGGIHGHTPLNQPIITKADGGNTIAKQIDRAKGGAGDCATIGEVEIAPITILINRCYASGIADTDGPLIFKRSGIGGKTAVQCAAIDE